MARRRRRSHSNSPRRRRRHYRRNPGLGNITKGLDLKTAGLAVVGAALSKMIVARLPIPADPKIQAAAQIASGLAMQMIPGVPTGIKSKLGLGAQIAGVSALLSQFAPQYFAGVADVAQVAQLSDDGAILTSDTDEYMLHGLGDPLEPELVGTL